MEILAIIFWSVVLLADLAFMTQISRVAREVENATEKRPGRAGTRTRGCHKRTMGLYHDYEEDAR